MRCFVPIFLALGLVGCVGQTSQQKTMAAGAVTAKFVDGAHGSYSTEYRSRLSSCDPSQDSSSVVTNKREMDECMGKGFAYGDHEKIGLVLKVYEVAARSLEAALLRGGAPEQQAAYQAVAKAAFELLQLLPEGSELYTRLKGMIAPWGF